MDRRKDKRAGERKNATILVVDDNEATRYILARSLRAAGYSVVEAGDGEEALRLAREKPDLITLDVHLPDISGIEVCRQIKENPELRTTPVIHISATFVDTEAKVAALNSGADGYLTHPTEDIVLVATVRAFLRARAAEREQEQLLRQSRQDLEALHQERALREQFVATLSHDLRTPLTAARMSAQFILRQTDISETTQRHANRIKVGIDRADHMIRDLLDVNRVRAGENLPIDLRPCDLHLVVEEVLGELGSLYGDRFVLRSPGAVSGRWDCDAIKRIVENLVGNAIKYGSEHRPVTVSLLEEADAVKILVNNEGNPIAPEDLDGLFRPYSRTLSAMRSGQRGWGLGLTLVRGMVEAHGGSVSVESTPVSGTTFAVTLPRNAAADLRAGTG